VEHAVFGVLRTYRRLGHHKQQQQEGLISGEGSNNHSSRSSPDCHRGRVDGSQ